MSLSLFGVKNNWHKNGIWWFTKILNKAVGEEKYDALRLQRRIWGMRFYYARQQCLYEVFVDHPDLANWVLIPRSILLTVSPSTVNYYYFLKKSKEQGYLQKSIYLSVCTYEMYRDFQENTLNSDGSFAQWITLVCGIYVAHVIYSYMIPYYWYHKAYLQLTQVVSTPLKNDEFTRLRMKDYIASSVLEEIYGISYAEWGWLPHDFAYNRVRGLQGYMHPDDPRAMCTSTFHRKHKYVEHEMDKVGDYHHMTYPK